MTEISEKTPFDASVQFVIKNCSLELTQVQDEFDAIKPGLGSQAKELITLFSASFGVQPGDAEKTRELLANFAQSGRLTYDIQRGCFFIEQDETRFDLNPFRGDTLLNRKTLEIGRKLHEVYSRKSHREVAPNDTILGTAIWAISHDVKILLEQRDAAKL